VSERATKRVSRFARQQGSKATERERTPRIWALLGPRTGDNNQVLALAEALGGSVETKPLRHGLPRVFALLNRVGAAGGGAGLDAASRATLAPPWPDVVIVAGWRGVAVARSVKARSGGRVRVLGIGRPRCHPSRLDLVVTTPQYGLPPGPSVLENPFCLSRQTPDRLAEAARLWAGRFQAYPEPRLVLLLGGDSSPFRLRPEDARAACAALAARAAARGGSVLAVGSRRTSPEVLEIVRTALEAAPVPAALLGGEGAENPYPGLLALADEIAVTADSAAMVSDAIAAGKPVGLVPVHAAGIAGASLRLARAVRRAAEGGEPVNPLARIAGRCWGALVRRGVAGWPRDLWFFWREVERRGLAGTADRPAWGALPPSVVAAEAAARVRRLLPPPPSDQPPTTPAARAGRGGDPPARARRGGYGAP
jgi:mitochondrial fission protein ELM1